MNLIDTLCTPGENTFKSNSQESWRSCVAGTSIVFDMSLTYILVALLAVILNNVLVERLSMHTRITVGKSDGNPLTDRALIEKHFSLWVLLLLLIYYCNDSLGTSRLFRTEYAE